MLIKKYGLQDRLHLVGPQAGAELDASYAAADLMVLASYAETYGMAVTEALARGIPVLATDVGGLPEAVGRAPDGGVPGILVPPEDPAALAAELRGWFGEADVRRRLKAAARGRMGRPGRLGDHGPQPGRSTRPTPERALEGGMRKTATKQSGKIPAQPGPREVASVKPGVPSDTESVIPGAGPSAHPGERPTVRLRDAGPDDAPRYAPEWLELREGPDAAARAGDLIDPLRIRLANLPGKAGLVIHDLGCGTGSMGRWLAPRLDGPQHWILHDRDPYLLHFAAVASPRSAADGSRVTVETRRGDVGLLTPDALAGASLVTASALLDVLTRGEIETLAAACTGSRLPGPAHPVRSGPRRTHSVRPAGRRDRRRLQRPSAARRTARPGRRHRRLRGVLRTGRDGTAAPERLAPRPGRVRAHRPVAARLGRRGRRGAARAEGARRALSPGSSGGLPRGRVEGRRPPQRPAGAVPADGRSVMSVETVRPDTERHAERTARREEDLSTRGDDAGAGDGREALPVRSTGHGAARLPVRRPAEASEPGTLSRRALTLQAEVVQTRDEVLTARAEALVARARILEAAGESVADLTAAVSRDRIGVIVTEARPRPARAPRWRTALRGVLNSSALRTHIGTVAGVTILAVLLWRLGTGVFLDGLRRIDE